jgi:hypothetical protein
MTSWGSWFWPRFWRHNLTLKLSRTRPSQNHPPPNWKSTAITLLSLRAFVACESVKPTNIIPGTTFKRKIIEPKMCFDFIYKFCQKTFLLLSRTERDSILLSRHYYCQILTTLEFYRKIFQKFSNTKFHENPHSGTGGQTDSKEGADSHISQIFKSD